MLKATHLPFVAIILAFEYGRRFIAQRAVVRPPAALPTSQGRPLSASQDRRGSIRAANRSSLLVPATPTRETQASSLFNLTSPAAPVATAANVADLVRLVQKLSSQVEELTSIVAGRQKD